jgi:outer membrane protein
VKNVLLFTILVFACSNIFAQTVQKTGYVDSQIILAQYAPAIKAQSDLDALAAKWTAQRDSMLAELQTAYQSYGTQKEMMTPDKQRETEQDLVMKQQKIQRFESEKFAQPNGELYKKNEEFLAPVKAKIMDAIAQVAQQEGLHFVFDKTGDVILLYADDQFDVTYKVLDKLKTGKK